MSAPGGTATIAVLLLDTGTTFRGGQRHELWLMDGLRAHGHRPVLAARAGAPLVAQAAAHGIPVVPIAPTFAEWGPWTVLRLRRAIRRHGIRIVHAHDSHSVGLAALAVAGTGARMVVTRHVVFPLRRNAGTRLKYGRADHLVAVSGAVARALQAGGIPERKLTVIPAGMPPMPPTAAASPETLRAIGVVPGRPLVVMITSLYVYKDPLLFVRAIAEVRRSVPDVQAVLTGDGPMRDEVAREIAALGLDGVVHLAGYRDDALALTAAADVVCLTSREEGLPLVVLEGMALRRPVVATAAGGTGEMLRDGVEGYLRPVGDMQGVADGVVRLLRSPDLARRMGDAGAERVAAFSMASTVERTIALYERVLAGRSGDGPPAR